MKLIRTYAHINACMSIFSCVCDQCCLVLVVALKYLLELTSLGSLKSKMVILKLSPQLEADYCCDLEILAFIQH